MITDLRVVADGFHFLEGPRWRDGRLWVSDMHGERVVTVTPDGRVEPAADDLAFPNGTVITPDGGTLIVAETFAHRLTAFTIAPGGRLAGRRTWASLDEQVYPDGICLDAEGAIWVASPLTNEAIRVAERGAVTDRVAADRHVIACMLGGVDRRTLFVLAATAIPRAEARAQRGARILATTGDGPGAGSP